MSRQLPLVLGRKDGAVFDSYYPGPNGEVVAYLRRLAEETGEVPVYLWGDAGTGKSHLLQAVCQAACHRGTAAIYLPLNATDQFPCEALDGIENIAVVCVDDVQAIAGRRDWEMALLKLFERIQDRRGVFVAAGRSVPAALALEVAQLVSRLVGGLVFQLQGLNDPDRLQALQLRSARRGLELPAEVARYLLRHYGGGMATLIEALNALDRASLAAQRRLTVPFVSAALRDAGVHADPAPRPPE